MSAHFPAAKPAEGFVWHASEHAAGSTLSGERARPGRRLPRPRGRLLDAASGVAGRVFRGTFGGCLRTRLAFPLLLSAVAALAASAQAPAPNPVPAVTARGFTAPVTDAAGRRTGLVTGDSAQPDLVAGRVRVTGFQFESYADGPEPTVELVIRAADAVFQLNPPSASGAGVLELARPDGRFSVRGEGWSWEERRGVLRITNRVETTLLPSTNRPAAPGAPAEAPVRVTAGRFEYDLRDGGVRYDADVRAVREASLDLAASSLRTRVARPGEPPQALDAAGPLTLLLGPATNQTRLTGDGGRFLAGPAGPELVLTGAVTWANPLLAGRSARLEARPDAGEFTAGGGVDLAVAATALARGTNAPATNAPPLAIRAAEVQARPGHIRFLGGVDARRAEDFALTAQAGELRLTPTNTFAGLLAVGDVLAEFSEAARTNRVSGGRIEVTPTPAGERIEVTESPRWSARGLDGAAGRLVLEPACQHVVADGPAELDLALAGATNRPPDKVRVSAAGLEALGTNVVLAGPVTARHPRWEVRAGAATLGLGEGLALRSITAGGGVEFETAEAPPGTNAAPVGRLLTGLVGTVTRLRVEAFEADAGFDDEGRLVLDEARGGIRLRAGDLAGTGGRMRRDAATGELLLLDSPALRSAQGFQLSGRPETVIRVDPLTGRGRVAGPLAEPMRVPAAALRPPAAPGDAAAPTAP